MTTDKKEAFPLSWPADEPRTRPQDRRKMTVWKRSASQYREALITEVERMGSPSMVISSNVPVNVRGALERGIEPLDVGVAVYFSRKIKEDFSWQEALGIHDPAPTEAQVMEAYRVLARRYHPDTGGDIAMFHAITKHRDNALRWIGQKTNQKFDFVIACDLFREVRLNMAAIVLTLKALRQIERCGTTSLYERAFRGFSALPAQAGPTATGQATGTGS